jgi:hypothetical protein
MKNTIKWLGIIALTAVIGFSLAACNNGNNDDGEGDPPIDYYDYAGIGVSNAAVTVLNSSDFYANTVYSGNRAILLLNIVANYPASNSNDTVYQKRTYEQVRSWLNGFNLPINILTLAKNSITAYCYYDISSNLWAVFVEDVSADYRSVLTKFILENTITQKEGYLQKEKKK